MVMLLIKDRVDSIDDNIKDNDIKNNTKDNSSSNTKDNNTLNNILDCNNSILNFKETTPNPLPLPLKGEGELEVYTSREKGRLFSFKNIFKDIFSSIKLRYNSAFSLIELSIVLIIIGLLVAGITGGASLIQSAKIRSTINEMEGYKRAVYTSLAVNNRLPGDLNNDGYIGPCMIYDSVKYGKPCVVETYSTTSFEEPYNVAASVPDSYSAPFVDLYLSKIIDFQPDPSNINIAGKGYPASSIHKDGAYYYTFYKTKSGTISGYYMANVPSEALFLQFNALSSSNLLSPDFFKKVDEKIDDGIHNNGIFRMRCYSGDDQGYEYAKANNTKCTTTSYKIR